MAICLHSNIHSFCNIIVLLLCRFVCPFILPMYVQEVFVQLHGQKVEASYTLYGLVTSFLFDKKQRNEENVDEILICKSYEN